MEKTPNAPRSLIFSTRLYRALLAVYPTEFRQEYGSPMLQAFRDSSRRALLKSGTAGLLSLWIRTVLDTVQTALEEHSQRGVDMSKEKFFKLSGWALMFGGLAILLGFLAGARPEYNRFNLLSARIDLFINAVEIPLFVMGALLLSVGLIGLFLRYGQRSGSIGRFSLGLGAISGVISAVGLIVGAIYDGEYWWPIWFLGMTFQFLGLALFGIVNLRQRLLPRWNGLPLLTGIWVPLSVFMGISIEQITGQWVEVPEVVSTILLLLPLAGLAGLGYLLHSDSRSAGTASAAV